MSDLLEITSPEAHGNARERLIQAAAQHFSEHGFEGASLRAIQREAGVNSAATHYYFGSKQALYREVVRTYLLQIQDERQRRMDAVPPGLSGEERLEAIISAYVEPHFELALSKTGRPYGRILARALIEPPRATNAIFPELINPLRMRLISALQEIFPNCSDDVLDRAISLTVMVMADVPYSANWKSLSEVSEGIEFARGWIEQVTDFACAGIIRLCKGAGGSPGS